jgi:chemotaxis protein MotA
MTTYLDLTSLVIVIGGTLLATVLHYSLLEIRNAYQFIKKAFLDREKLPTETLLHTRLQDLLSISREVRAEGRLILEEQALLEKDALLKLGFELLVDNVPPEELRHLLHVEYLTQKSNGEQVIKVLEAAANYAPAMGLIGTLLGLVDLLSQLGKPANLGGSMAVALLTTLYGSLLANLLLLPLAGRIKTQISKKESLNILSLEGLLLIATGENPLLMGQKLKVFANARDS